MESINYKIMKTFLMTKYILRIDFSKIKNKNNLLKKIKMKEIIKKYLIN